jgi:transcription initiation factor IIF auxiliary subunit
MDDKIKSTERCVKYEYIKTDPVIEALKKEFDQRSFVGIKKYGTTLHDNNEDDFLLHLQQELMDACAYIMKLRMKKEK